MLRRWSSSRPATARPPTGATGYRFDFGDGTPAVSGPSPLALHPYQAAGTYTVTLTVTDGQGHSATDTASLKVGP